MDPIVTRWHKVLECVQNNSYSFTQHVGDSNDDVMKMRGMMDDERLGMLMEAMNRCPKFYFEPKLIESMSATGVEDSLQAMHEGGVATLPFPQILVEYEAESSTRSGASVRNFAFLYVRDPKREAVLGEKIFHPFRAFVMRHVLRPNGQQMVFFSPFTLLVSFDLRADDGAGGVGFGYHYLVYESPLVLRQYRSHALVQRALDREGEGLQDVNLASIAMSSSVLLLNTRGVAKEPVSPPPKLNAARAKRKRPPIPEYVLIRVGQVYGRDGRVVAESGGRASPRVHWRRAHLRNVRHGPGRTETRPVVVAPCLVNYADGPEPERPRYLVRDAQGRTTSLADPPPT